MVSGLAIKGQSPARLSVQQQEALAPASEQQEEQPTPYQVISWALALVLYGHIKNVLLMFHTLFNQFSYEAQSEENTGSSRSETADGTGKVFGQYAIKGADGISRIVSYTADSEGFR